LARFLTLAVSTIFLTLAMNLWNAINIFGVSSIVGDQTNTITGQLISLVGCSSTNGIPTSCANNLLLGIGIVQLAAIAAGGVTIIAFGNTYLAQGLLVAFTPCIATLYDTITTILDVFQVPSGVIVGIDGMVLTVFIISFVGSLITLQGKIYLTP